MPATLTYNYSNICGDKERGKGEKMLRKYIYIYKYVYVSLCLFTQVIIINFWLKEKPDIHVINEVINLVSEIRLKWKFQFHNHLSCELGLIFY